MDPAFAAEIIFQFPFYGNHISQSN